MKLKYDIPEGFLDEETRGDYTVSTEMKKVWAVELDLLQYLLEVCERHNLHIYAEGGTLLGAVRHKGYIPWDDDIDMIMLREDYDKLMALTDEFKHPYFLQNVYTDAHYTHRHAQIRNCNTACWARQAKRKREKYNQGIFIDIFPADNMPVTPRAISRYYKKEGLARQKFRLVSRFINKLPEPIYQWCRQHTTLLSDKNCYAKYEELLRKVPFNRFGSVCEIAFKHSYPFYPTAYFDTVQYLDFEYIKMPVCGNPAGFLELQFGPDYMTPQQTPTEHGGLCYDTEHSYTEILDYEQHIS